MDKMVCIHSERYLGKPFLSSRGMKESRGRVIVLYLSLHISHCLKQFLYILGSLTLIVNWN